MYCSFYGISEKPFNITPDPRFLFFGATHREAFAHLIYGIRERGGFVVITGEIGTGKTTLCRAILEYMDKDTLVAFVFNPTLSAIELLKTINQDFGISSSGTTKKELIDELNQFLLEKRGEGKNTILIIDEAQNLEPEVLEQIRLLSNLETNTEKLLQIILIGQPELLEILEQRGLRQLNQRITVRYHLQSLSSLECEDYIRHRLAVVGAEGKVTFTKEALKRIYQYTRGVPRLVNVLCDRALLAGYTLGTTELDGRIVTRAYKEVFGRSRNLAAPTSERIRPKRAFLGAGAGMVVLLLLIGGFLLFGRHLTHSPPLETSGAETNGAGTLHTAPSAPGPGDARVAESVENVGLGQGPESAAPPASEQPEAGEQPTVAQGSGEEAEGPRPIVSPETPVVTKEAVRERFQGKSLLETKRIALAALLHSWGQLPEGEVALPANDSLDVYKIAEKFGLLCSYIAGNVNLLRCLNLPAVLPLNFGGPAGKRYVCLRRLDGEQAVIAPPLDETTATVPLSVLSEFWFGNAYVFWKDFKMQGRHLARGVCGSDVAWLQHCLRDMGYSLADKPGVFGSDTEAALRAFQRDHFLDEDGVVGPMTKMVLYHRLKEFPMPSLAGQQ